MSELKVGDEVFFYDKDAAPVYCKIVEMNSLGTLYHLLKDKVTGLYHCCPCSYVYPVEKNIEPIVEPEWDE